ncbi:MAG TPA: PEP-CTERM sorting domain-containing protein [Acetobacteraceae bacterium]|nr:PEP-CTERM sorting domain-containing protein [Acetobacteraceae bacterium]
MPRFLPAAAAALALMAASGTALADPITYAGSFSITDISNPHNNLLNVTSTPGGFSVPLYLNKEVKDITLANYFTTDPNHSSWGSIATDEIKGTFTFTKPVSNVYSVNGDVTEITADFWGHFSSAGVLNWDKNDLNVAFSDGSMLDIDMGPSYFANANGTSDAGTVSANFTLIKEPVPEPASMTLFGAGLLGLGTIAMRRRGRLDK